MTSYLEVMANYLVTHLNIFTVVFGLFGAAWYILSFVIKIERSTSIVLELMLAKTFSAVAMPLGVTLIFCAFDPSLMSSLSGFNLHIAVAGLSVLYISIKALWRN